MNSNVVDMLVRLYALPDFTALQASLASQGVLLRRPRAYEKDLLLQWVKTNFSQGWADECDVCFSRFPVSCHIATHEHQIVAFACHEATCKGFFGPIGVASEWRGRGLGTLMLLSSLAAMHDLGYAYAIIGGPTTAVPFYKRCVGATVIEGSTPGIYVDRLQGSDS